MDNIKTMTATEFDKSNAIYQLLNILETYRSVIVTRYGDAVLVIHRPDAPVVGMERDDIDSTHTPRV